MKLRHFFGILVLVLLGGVFTLWRVGFDPESLSKLSFYFDLANPSVKVVRVEEGLRKEEIAELVGDQLGWSPLERNMFINAHLAFNTYDREGRYFPKTYLLKKDERPTNVSKVMFEEFEKETNKIKSKYSAEVLNEETIVRIASIIQREAAGKHDMRLVSGIIWNRLWDGMKLQMDATLQYAKGNEEDGWWNKVYSEDKYIDSDYNTYQNKGLPPGAIANPGKAAIEAAYNPQQTSCMFYLHDKKGRIHCSETYTDHKANIRRYY